MYTSATRPYVVYVCVCEFYPGNKSPYLIFRVFTSPVIEKFCCTDSGQTNSSLVSQSLTFRHLADTSFSFMLFKYVICIANQFLPCMSGPEKNHCNVLGSIAIWLKKCMFNI